MPETRSLLLLSALPSAGVRELLDATATIARGGRVSLTARAPVALLCGRPCPYVRSVVEGASALLGLRVAVYGPDEVAALGEPRLAAGRLAQVHAALIGAALPSGMLAELAAGGACVVNGGDADGDPFGALADLHLFGVRLGGLAGRRLTWVGDASGLLYDLLAGGCGLGLSAAVAHPVGFAPSPDRVTLARERAAESGAAVLVTTELGEALADASVVYVEAWPAEHVERFRPYAVQRHALRNSHSGALILHRAPGGPELSPSFADDVARFALLQHRARVDACAAVLAACLRPDPLTSVVG